MGNNSTSQKDLNENIGVLKSASYSTLNLNRKFNIYTNSSKINSTETGRNYSQISKSNRRKKSASTSSLSSLGNKTVISKNLKWLYFGKNKNSIKIKNIHFSF